ncbi:phosphonate C-P lyase system protein PhnG [Ruminococcus sp.]|jgi:alpha-D-ribose 1-methylphosphonate 5-triphosphate synthase subunit PhnG|uniref:phosphonate C-P lyase system protein PhnG n=1 Tax=Ruminococcus sp. TaxID=41978 RepID=UPI0026055626|nr:phosphonate C-P lyase system protein PhnG [Ruminococcus sp.]MEE0023422.1 phosphonate C-P lyase system protein PhnG [Ruminococcus sp.]
MQISKGQLRKVRTKTGMIFQHYNLVDRLSVMENVLHGRLGQKSTLSGMIGHYTEDEKEKAFVTEAVVTLESTVGTAVTMGDDFEKTLYMAVIDAAENKGVFVHEDLLVKWEQTQQRRIAQENAMFQQTKVDFHAMDSEAAQ